MEKGGQKMNGNEVVEWESQSRMSNPLSSMVLCHQPKGKSQREAGERLVDSTSLHVLETLTLCILHITFDILAKVQCMYLCTVRIIGWFKDSDKTC